MLTAISSGKAGRIQIEESEFSLSWREVFRCSEDLLTAAFFSRLRYLSENSLVRVLSLLIGPEAANSLGELKEAEFWPHLTGLKDRSWVEPDVLLHFEAATLMVEVKPPFGGDQYLVQWQAEVHAFVAECLNGTRNPPETLHFLALGRNNRQPDENLYAEFATRGCFELALHTCEWEPLIKALPDLSSDCLRSDKAIFEDWQRAFDLFGLQVEVAPSWGDLVVKASTSRLSLQPLNAWPLASRCAPDLTHPIMTKETPSSWQALFAFTRTNPLELPAWK